jgi:hypothetical protein
MNEVRSDQHVDRHVMVTLGLAGVIVLSLGVGFLAGYVVGGGRSMQTTGPIAASPGMATADASHIQGGGNGHAVGPGGTISCVYDLPAKDQWMLSGMTCVCTEPHCNRTPLLACHCDNAHAMKTLAKQMIVEGKSAEEIGAALEKRYGPGVLPAGAAAQPPRVEAKH